MQSYYKLASRAPKERPKLIYTMRSKVIYYKAAASAWYLVILPKQKARTIKLHHGSSSRWGSIKVNAKIGSFEWPTSIFPAKKENSYLLLLNATVRKKENVLPGKLINYELSIH